MKKEERRQSFAISAVFVFVFVVCHEPCATLALWLGWMKRFLQDVNSGPDHSVIESKMRGRLPSTKLHHISKIISTY